jgi:hypothetical protein
MATVNEERLRCHAVAHETTCATSVAERSVGAHGWILTANLTLPFRRAEREGGNPKVRCAFGRRLQQLG